MSNYYPIYQSFNGGEISPLLLTQVESDIYKNGVRHMFNMLPNSHGPALRRDGLKYISEVDEQAIPVKMIPFNASLDKDYIVIIGNKWVQVYDDNGPAFGGLGATNLITNGTFNTGIAGWTDNSGGGGAGISWNSVSKRMTINSDSGGGGSRNGAAYQNVTLSDSSGVQYNLIFSLYENTAGSTYEIRVGTAAGLFDILQQVVTPGLTQTVQFTPAAAVTNVFVEFWVSGDGGSADIDNVAMRETAAPTVLLQWASPYAGQSGIEFIESAIAPGGNPALYICHPNVAPYALVLTITTNTWDFFAVPFTNPPAEWGTNNWPRAVTFFGQRSWYGNIKSSPEKFWGSTVGDFIDFSPGTSQADEAIEYEIAQRGDILFMSGAKNLIIGTEHSEFLVVSDGGVLIPGDVEVKQQSSYGSFFGVQEQAGDRVLYISATGTRLRNMAYEWTKDAWISIDMAWQAEHLIRDIVTQMAYQFDPQQVIWMITSGNNLISCSYDREQGIVGWAQHGSRSLKVFGDESVGIPTDPGTAKFAGICVSSVFGINKLWATLQYLDGDDPQVQHTILLQLNSAATMDGFIEYVAGAPTNIVPGLEHLEGLPVDILVDGAVDPTQIVSGGQVTTQTTGLQFFVGVGNTAYMKTLPREGGNPAGTAQGSMKRDPFIYVRLIESTIPVINGKRPPDRTPSTPMNTREGLVSGDVKISDIGWDRTAAIEIWETLPLPLNVAGVFTKDATKPR